MTDSIQKQVRDRLKADLLASPSSLRKVYDMDTPDAKIFPHAVLLINEAAINQADGKPGYGTDSHMYTVIILIRDNDPEDVRKKMEIVQVLWRDSGRFAALAELNGYMSPVGKFAPQNDSSGKTKGVLTGILTFDLEIRYFYG